MKITIYLHVTEEDVEEKKEPTQVTLENSVLTQNCKAKYKILYINMVLPLVNLLLTRAHVNTPETILHIY